MGNRPLTQTQRQRLWREGKHQDAQGNLLPIEAAVLAHEKRIGAAWP